MKHRSLMLAVFLVASIVHAVASWVAFSRSEVIRAGSTTETWRGVSELLAFPLLYVANASSTLDLFPLMFVLNSALWGAGVCCLAIMIKRLVDR